MNIKFLARIAMMVAALAMLTGCGSEKDTPDDPVEPPTPTSQERVWSAANNRPEWFVDWSSNVATPQWTAPDIRKYEKWMLIMVRIQDELLPYVSSNDLMSVEINDETRVVASPAQDSSSDPSQQTYNYFLLRVLGNEDAEQMVNFTIKYYNARLKQLFEASGPEYFIPEMVYGAEQDFCIDFLASCNKYPVKSYLTFILPEDITPAAGDMMGVFVGNECRGVKVISMDDLTNGNTLSLVAYGHEDGEQATIIYYSQEKGTTTFENTVRLTSTDVITLN